MIELTVDGCSAYLAVDYIVGILDNKQRPGTAVVYTSEPLGALSVEEDVDTVFALVYEETSGDEVV